MAGGNDDQGDDMAEDRSISHSSVSYTSMQGSGLMKTQKLPHIIGSRFFMSEKFIGKNYQNKYMRGRRKVSNDEINIYVLRSLQY